ncbi:hypothetical protein DJ568_12030 [Mucilaginibacter hurinus]|uniref:Lipoprotein n=1 Tax=Mucilaginibacter hurinus TaxID=2201324 RepID=A0A367GPC6_9SPHI|nr:hypothetical protein [Mucilaginibacter hurinus]RCH54543.1 hypothetical protein DJ568_12030 [Mucilaginibacter hurinus]
MKKLLLSVFALTVLFFAACKKDKNKPNPQPDSPYQPFTSGSTWKYRVVDGSGETAEADTILNKMTGDTRTFNGKTFHVLISKEMVMPESASVSKLKINEGPAGDETYIGFNNNIYSSFYEDEYNRIEIGYLNLDKAVGEAWTEKISFKEDGTNLEGQVKTTTIEKGLSKTLHGKTYNDVIHSKVELQVKTGDSYTTKVSLEFLTAKNIGVISTTGNIDGEESVSELIDYNIK